MRQKKFRRVFVMLALPVLIGIGVVGWLLCVAASPKPKPVQKISAQQDSNLDAYCAVLDGA